jgi:outer membrane lipoprotein-sorting protein
MKTGFIMLMFWLSMGLYSWASNECNEPAIPADGQPSSCEQKTDVQPDEKLQNILAKIVDATRHLQTCQARLSYLFIQDPELLASRTLRTGMLFYTNGGEQSRLRIQFVDLKQDDFEPEQRREEYLFDGVWLTRIDFKLKQIDRFQQAPEDKPIDVFDLVSHNFPLVGFSETEKLQNEFDISLKDKESDPNKPVCLLLKVKKDSKFHKEYEKIDFWIDPATYLPHRLLAYAVGGDLYDITFSDVQTNKKLENSVFTVETPADFRKNIEPLKDPNDLKGN